MLPEVKKVIQGESLQVRVICPLLVDLVCKLRQQNGIVILAAISIVLLVSALGDCCALALQRALHMCVYRTHTHLSFNRLNKVGAAEVAGAQLGLLSRSRAFGVYTCTIKLAIIVLYTGSCQEGGSLRMQIMEARGQHFKCLGWPIPSMPSSRKVTRIQVLEGHSDDD
eukprot:scaffold203452_cov21-Tisochrysis_lutea.AAC.1